MGPELIAADAPTFFTDDTPTAQMVRSILSAIGEFEKSSLVVKLKAARMRTKRETGGCKGNKSAIENNPNYSNKCNV